MSSRRFPIVQVVADDGQRRSMAELICGECGQVGHVAAHGGRHPIPDNALARMFRAKGWAVGIIMADDTCPDCSGAPSSESVVRIEPFFNECIEPAPGNRVPAALLHEAYKAWCRRRGLSRESMRTFVRALRQRGAKRIRSSTNFWVGIAIRTEAIPQVKQENSDMSNADEPHQAEEPPKCTPPMRRVIYGELCGVYDDGIGRYIDGCDDFALARKLNVPRVWISEVREHFFGPLKIDPALQETLQAARKILGDAMSVADRATRLADQIEKELGLVRSELAQARAAIKAANIGVDEAQRQLSGFIVASGGAVS